MLLDSIEAQLPDAPYSVVPTSFDPHDDGLRAFPRSLETRWTSAENFFLNVGARGIMMRLPLFWQMEPLLFAAGQMAGAPLFVCDQSNMPLGAAAIRTAHMDTVVTDAGDAFAFSDYLVLTGAVAPKAWLVVHAFDAHSWDTPAALVDARLAQEVHLFPGIPVLASCERAPKVGAGFHACNDYRVDINETARLTSINDEDPLPLLNYDTEVPLAASGTCICGREIFVRA
jgi:hypothetical protein